MAYDLLESIALQEMAIAQLIQAETNAWHQLANRSALDPHLHEFQEHLRQILEALEGKQKHLARVHRLCSALLKQQSFHSGSKE